MIKNAIRRFNPNKSMGFIALTYVIFMLGAPTHANDDRETNVEEIVRELRSKGLISEEEATEIKVEHGSEIRADVSAIDSPPITHRGSPESGLSDVLSYEFIIILTIVLVAFGLPALTILCVSYWSFRRRKLMHQTIDALIAKDRELPQSMLTFIDKTYSGKTQYFEVGVFLIAMGTALLIGLWVLVGPGVGMLIGLPPTAIGVGNIILWRAEKRRKELADANNSV
ncbi:MAG: hypothetical protein KTR16_13935 [Acidiferrobacterales bacterium]|nr:hypothetical protein [Acidiferrobacterales bacterium]